MVNARADVFSVVTVHMKPNQETLHLCLSDTVFNQARKLLLNADQLLRYPIATRDGLKGW